MILSFNNRQRITFPLLTAFSVFKLIIMLSFLRYKKHNHRNFYTYSTFLPHSAPRRYSLLGIVTISG